MALIATLLGSIVSFVVGLLVGGLGIYVGAQVMADEGDYEHAVVTAFLGALAWGLVSLLVGWIPLLGAVLGPLLALAAYVGIINWRYPGGWVTAAGIALVAWLASLAVLAVLAVLDLGVPVVGVPGV